MRSAPPAAIDWTAPWLAPWRATGEAAAASVAQGARVADALNARLAGAAMPAAFVPQARLPAETPYEAFIFDTRTVPTRDNLHDFFNGLAWLRFPQSKRRLNELQAREIARSGIGATRGPLRDALTLFDENGAVLDAPPALWRALRARDWRSLFVDQRALWREARLLVFGHALLEKLAAPRKAATAHVLPAAGLLPSILAGDDAAMVAVLGDAAHLAAKPFLPLPVLGVPGWWPGNEVPGFYDDAAVFRPPRGPGVALVTSASTPARR